MELVAEPPHTHVIYTAKDEQRCWQRAVMVELQGKFGQEDDRHASKAGLPLRERAPGIFSGEKIFL